MLFMSAATINASADIGLAYPQSALYNNNLALNQSREVVCGNGSTTFARAETKRYYANICGDSGVPKVYVGSSKTGQTIVLPLKTYSNGQYVATSGDIKYTLNSSYLTVTRNGRVILKERVVSWR